MNFKYLKSIKEGKANQPGYLIKQLESVEGAHDHKMVQQLRTHSSYYLSFPKNIDNYTYEDFLLDFRDLLDLRKHIFSEKIVTIITLYFLRIRDKSISTEKAWSHFSQSFFTQCELHLEYPIIGMTGDMKEPLKLETYTIGNFDATTFRDKLLELPKTNYWELFLSENKYSIEELKHFLSFKRTYPKITIIDYLLLSIKKYASENEISIINDLYFEALTIQYFKNFWKELDDQLIDSLAFGGAYYSPKMFQHLTIGRCTQVAIFSKIKKYPPNGWVIPLTHGSMLLNFDSQKKIPELNRDLQNYYYSISNNDSDFLHPIRFLVHFLGNGVKLLYDEKIEEAFINFWLALDSIFNKENISNKLKNRVAVLTWKKYNTDHESQYNLINKLYKSRNAYVHNGVKIERELCLELNFVLQTILEILLKLHQLPIEKGKLSKDEWISYIDKSYEFFYKENSQNPDLLDKIGV